MRCFLKLAASAVVLLAWPVPVFTQTQTRPLQVNIGWTSFQNYLDANGPAQIASCTNNPTANTVSPPFSTTRDVKVAGSGCGAPAGAGAFVFNATAIPVASLGSLTVWPQGTPQPSIPTLLAP